jgi:hypothetical protein
MLKRVFVLLVFHGLTIPNLFGQQALTELSLTDLSAFKPQAGNWMIVGDVTIDPNTDIHDKILVSQPQQATKKGKKATPPPPVYVNAQPVTFKAGTGILLNMNDEQKKSNLISVFEHGDIEIELELMVPKGSNSGIYLQGRYEVQILDSWGVKSPKFSDILRATSTWARLRSPIPRKRLAHGKNSGSFFRPLGLMQPARKSLTQNLYPLS